MLLVRPIILKLRICYTKEKGVELMLEKKYKVHYKVIKKEKILGCRKDWVQPRRVMKGRPRMTVVLQAYRAISPNWSRKTEGSRRNGSGEKGDSDHFILSLRMWNNLRSR